VLGVTTAWGDTDLRARLTKRFLEVTGHGDIPVAAGPKTKTPSAFTQARWAQIEPEPANGWPDATQFTLDAIRRNPGQITLIAIAPFSNVGALIDRDPATFRKLKRVVLMGGSIHRRYGDLGYFPDHGPEAEYNIAMDAASSKKLFTSGVPIEMMPLDSTQLKLDEVMRDIVFSQGTPTTDALTSLYEEWHASSGNSTPTLFDAMAVAAAIDPALCPTTPMRIEVDDKGFTRPIAGTPNANVCLNSDSDQFFHFYIPAILGSSPHP
jgi:purine nucleosidase